MKTIIITGATGSGKSYLSNRLSKLYSNSIVINTDSYYRDDFLIRFLSIFLYDIYDRPLSIKKKEIKKTLRSIYRNEKIISIYKYDFKRKCSSQSKIRINYKGENPILILEGIFAHRLDLNYEETINILCQQKKEICFARRLKRDKLERGRNSSEVYKKFNRSWNLFYMNVQNYINKYKVLQINSLDKINYEKLVLDLQNSQKKNN